MLRPITSVITNKNGSFAITDQQIREAIQLFDDDLPHPELLECLHRKTFWINNKKELPETAAAAIKHVIQRFSELCENCRVLSHQILTVKTDLSETALEIMNHHAGKEQMLDVYKY